MSDNESLPNFNENSNPLNTRLKLIVLVVFFVIIIGSVFAISLQYSRQDEPTYIIQGSTGTYNQTRDASDNIINDGGFYIRFINGTNNPVILANSTSPLYGVNVTISDTTGGSETHLGTYNITLANGVTINNGGFQINMINGTNNPIRMVNTPNGVNITISDTTGAGGSITGNGVNGRVTFWNGTSSITSDAEFLYNATLNRLTINGGNGLTNSPFLVLDSERTSSIIVIRNDTNWTANYVLGTDDCDFPTGCEEKWGIEMVNDGTDNLHITDIPNTIDLINAPLNIDRADSGIYRYGNNEQTCAESSPTGSDPCITIADANENFIWNSIFNNIDFGSNPVITLILGGIMDAMGNTIDNIGTLIDNSADPADTGFIQTGNAVNVFCSESSPTGTDNCMQVDANENLIYDSDTISTGLVDASEVIPSAQTKTNIGSSFIDIYTDTGENNFPTLLNCEGHTQVRLLVYWNKIGTGTQTIQIADANNNSNVLVSVNVVTGTNDSGWLSIPSWCTGEVLSESQGKSTVAGDDPIALGHSIYLR